MIPINSLADAWHKQFDLREYLGPKQAQLIIAIYYWPKIYLIKRHFKNKNELYVEAILNGVRKSAIAKNYHKVVDDNQALDEIVRNYLAQVSTVKGPSPCPLAFLVTDVANRETEVREAYTISFKGLVKMLSRIIAIQDESKREAISRSIATLMIGGVAVGRALNDPQASQELVDACYKIAGMLAASA